MRGVTNWIPVTLVSSGICMDLDILRAPNFSAFCGEERIGQDLSDVASVGRHEDSARFRITG